MLLPLLLALTLLGASASGAAPAFPIWPFTRALSLAGGESGRDVFVLQGLLARAGCASPPALTSTFDAATAACLAFFQVRRALPPASRGALDAATAVAVLAVLGPDRYADDGRPAAELGYMYKVVITVLPNRSVEVPARLYAGNGTELRRYTVRLHGADGFPVEPWPTWNSSGAGLNSFTDDGATPTGLAEFDLNSPEANATEFGPYNVNRAVKGLRGNWKLLASGDADTMVRDGILQHTGEWPGWAPPAAMPNSLGCIHAWPADISAVSQALIALGVEVRRNTNGTLPYPFKPQGLLSVECPACIPAK